MPAATKEEAEAYAHDLADAWAERFHNYDPIQSTEPLRPSVVDFQMCEEIAELFDVRDLDANVRVEGIIGLGL